MVRNDMDLLIHLELQPNYVVSERGDTPSSFTQQEVFENVNKL